MRVGRPPGSGTGLCGGLVRCSCRLGCHSGRSYFQPVRAPNQLSLICRHTGSLPHHTVPSELLPRPGQRPASAAAPRLCCLR